MLRNKIIFALLITAIVSPTLAEDKVIADIMQRYDAKGTVIIASLAGDTLYVHNEDRANTRWTPALC